MGAEFTVKQLSQASRVCFRLKEAREQAGIAIEDVVEKTKLQRHYIEALENCEFDSLPHGDTYRRQFIKSYLKAIKVNPNSFIFQYNSEEAGEPIVSHPTTAKRQQFHNLPAYLRIGSLIVGALLMIGYLGWQVRHIVEPPDMVLHNPPNGFVTTDSTLMVQGETNKEVSIKINGKDVTNNGSGQFEERLDLSPGVNTITIAAKRKYGKSKIITRHVVFKEGQKLTSEHLIVPTNLP